MGQAFLRDHQEATVTVLQTPCHLLRGNKSSASDHPRVTGPLLALEVDGDRGYAHVSTAGPVGKGQGDSVSPRLERWFRGEHTATAALQTQHVRPRCSLTSFLTRLSAPGDWAAVLRAGCSFQGMLLSTCSLDLNVETNTPPVKTNS